MTDVFAWLIDTTKNWQLCPHGNFVACMTRLKIKKTGFDDVFLCVLMATLSRACSNLNKISSEVFQNTSLMRLIMYRDGAVLVETP